MATDRTTRGLGIWMIALTWLLLVALLWFLFDAWFERQQNPNRHLTLHAEETAELVLRRNRAGHYVAPGSINGRPVTFLLDTGATVVSVPAHLGPELGLAAGAPQSVMTANGIVTAHATRIDSLTLGPLRFVDLRGHLNPGMQGEQVLLGMSVLGHLEFTQRGDVLILRPPSF